MKKKHVILVRDVLVVIIVLITCFFVCRYNDVRMYVSIDGSSYRCKLSEYDKDILLKMIENSKENGELVKDADSQFSNVYVKYKNHTYRVADGLLEDKSLFTTRTYACLSNDYDNTEFFESIADMYYPLQTYFSNPDSGYSIITISKGKNNYQFSNADVISFDGMNYTDKLAEGIRKVLDKPAPFNPNGIKRTYAVTVNTRFSNHTIKIGEDHVIIDRKFYYNNPDTGLVELMELLTAQEDRTFEKNYWDYTPFTGY